MFKRQYATMNYQILIGNNFWIAIIIWSCIVSVQTSSLKYFPQNWLEMGLIFLNIKILIVIYCVLCCVLLNNLVSWSFSCLCVSIVFQIWSSSHALFHRKSWWFKEVHGWKKRPLFTQMVGKLLRSKKFVTRCYWPL